MMETSILNYIKSQGIFDQLRHECLVDIDKRPSYQNLVYKVEDFTKDFLSFQTWSPDINKNNLRDHLRQYINELPKIQIGLDYLVDKVVLPIIYYKSRTKLENEIKDYKKKMGFTKKNDSLVPKEKFSKKIASEKDFQKLYEHYDKLSKKNKFKNSTICRTSKSKQKLNYEDKESIYRRFSDPNIYCKKSKYLVNSSQLDVPTRRYNVNEDFAKIRDCFETKIDQPCGSQRLEKVYNSEKPSLPEHPKYRLPRDSPQLFSKQELHDRNKRPKHLYFPRGCIYPKYAPKTYLKPHNSNSKQTLALRCTKEKNFRHGTNVQNSKRRKSHHHSSDRSNSKHDSKSQNSESYLDVEKPLRKSKKHGNDQKHRRAEYSEEKAQDNTKPTKVVSSIIVRRKDVEGKRTLWRNGSSNITSSSCSSSPNKSQTNRCSRYQEEQQIVPSESSQSPDLMYQLLVQKTNMNDPLKTLSSFEYFSSGSSKTKSRKHRMKKRKKVKTQNDMYEKKYQRP